MGPACLQTVVRAHGPLSRDEQSRLAAGLASELAALHAAGRIHGQLTPAAVRLSPDRVELLAPEAARIADIAGYFAPEVITGRAAGAAADLFGFGAVLVFAATGAGPFGSGSPLRLWQRIVEAEPSVAGLPDDLRAVAVDCLRKDPDRRPTAAGLLARLENPDTPTESPPHGAATGRRPLLIAAALVLTLSLLGLAAFLGLRADPAETPAAAVVSDGPLLVPMPGVSDIEVSPDGRRVYLANRLQSMITVLDATTNRVAATVRLPGQPTGLAITRDGARLFAVTNSAVALVDTGSGRVSKQIPLDAGTVYDDIAVTPDGARLYLADGSRSTVSVIDPRAGAASATIPFRSGAYGRVSTLAMAPDGRALYVGHTDHLSVLDIATDTIRAEFPYPGTPQRMAVTPDGRLLYLFRFDPVVRVFDTAAAAYTTELRLTGIAIDAAPAPAGRHLFVAGQSLPPDDAKGLLAVVDIGTGSEVGAQAFVPGAGRIAVSPDGRRVYAADRNGAGLVVIDVSHFAR